MKSSAISFLRPVSTASLDAFFAIFLALSTIISSPSSAAAFFRNGLAAVVNILPPTYIGAPKAKPPNAPIPAPNLAGNVCGVN